MDDMDRETNAAEDTTPAVDRPEQPDTVSRAARLLANPRRVRRA